MDFNIEVRRKQLENLDQFISSSRDRVVSILDYLGWTAEKINETHKEMLKCPINPNHRILASKAKIHVQECAFRKEGYKKDDNFLSEPNFVPGSTILIDDVMKVNVLNDALSKNPLMKTGWRTADPIPRTSDHLLATFTPDERTVLYDYAVASTSGPAQVPEFNITESKKEERQNLTADEIKALGRDSKRRRIRYKAKSVHSSRKNTTEVMREIINGQMEAYEDWLRHELKQETVSEHSTSHRREPSSPRSSKSRHSQEDDAKKNGKRKHRSRSKESDRSRRISRSQSRSSSKRSINKYDRSNRHGHSSRRYDDSRDKGRNERRSHNQYSASRSKRRDRSRSRSTVEKSGR